MKEKFSRNSVRKKIENKKAEAITLLFTLLKINNFFCDSKSRLLGISIANAIFKKTVYEYLVENDIDPFAGEIFRAHAIMIRRLVFG